MNTDCLLPTDLARFVFEGREATTICSLYLHLPSSPLFSQFTLWDYLVRFAQAVVIEIPVFYFFVTRMKLVRAAQMSALLNLLTHPMVFFVWPSLGGQWNMSIGATLFMSQFFTWIVRYFALRARFDVHPIAALSGGFVASLASWWIGVILSY